MDQTGTTGARSLALRVVRKDPLTTAVIAATTAMSIAGARKPQVMDVLHRDKTTPRGGQAVLSLKGCADENGSGSNTMAELIGAMTVGMLVGMGVAALLGDREVSEALLRHPGRAAQKILETRRYPTLTV